MLRFWFRVTVFLLIVGATVVILLIDTNVWSGAPSWLITLLAVVLGVFAGYEWLFGAHRARQAALTRHVRDAQLAALFEISKLTKIPHAKLGLCCYVVPRWFLVLTPPRRLRSTVVRRLRKHPGLQGRLPKGPTLKRLDRLRPHGLNETAIPWSFGKGVIGLCWKSRKDVVLDFTKAYAPYIDCDRTGWARAPDNVRLGLTFDEFDRIRGKYGVVIASPILDGEEFIGCVTVDTSFDTDYPYYDRLWTRGVREILGNTATYIKEHHSRTDA